MRLGYAALNSCDRDSAVQLARQAAQVTVGVPGVIARWCSYSLTVVLIGAGDLAAAEPVCAEALAWSRDTGDLLTKATLLQMMVTVDLAAGRIQARRRTCGSHCSSRGRARGSRCSMTWTAAGICASRQGGSPRP
jgi:hypothetical protein